MTGTCCIVNIESIVVVVVVATSVVVMSGQCSMIGGGWRSIERLRRQGHILGTLVGSGIIIMTGDGRCR